MQTHCTPIGWNNPNYGELVEVEDVDGDKRVVSLAQLNQPDKKLLRLFDKVTGNPIETLSSGGCVIHRGNLYLSDKQERSQAWKVKSALLARHYEVLDRIPESDEEQFALLESGYKGFTLRNGELVELNWLGLVFAKPPNAEA